MARVAINTGSTANDGTGDTLRAAGGIINSNFSDIYNYFGDGTNLNFSSGNFEVTAVGINTLSSVGIGTTNPRFDLEVGAVGASGTSLWVNGDARVTGILTVGTASIVLDGASNTISVGSGVTINGSTGIIDATSIVVGGTTLTGAAVTRIEAGTGISVDQNTGQVTISATGGSIAGIDTAGTSFFNQLNVSGISTFSGRINAGADGILFDSDSYTGSAEPIKLWIGNSGGARYFTLHRSNGGQVVFDNKHPTGHNDHRASTHSFTETGSEYYALFYNGSVKLYHPGSASGILDQKFETTGAGVTITGTTFTDQLSVSGVSTLGTVQVSSGIVTATSGIVTYYGDTSNTAVGRWTLGANGTTDYTFTGIGFTQTTNDPVLYLARGRVYEFVNNSGGGHPFEIRVSNGGNAYSDGVTNNAAATGTIRFEVPFNAPNTLYYQCTNHSGMGNTISVYPNTI